MDIFKRISMKLNPAQRYIAENEGELIGTTQTAPRTLAQAFIETETANRCLHLIVDSGSQVGFDVKESLGFTATNPGARQKQLVRILNHKPNPFMDISSFMRLCLLDFVFDGNTFIHYDGNCLYHLPAASVEIKTDTKGYVSGYVFDGRQTFTANEIIHVADLSVRSVYRGESRAKAFLGSLASRDAILKFQKQFYDNGAVVGLMLKTDSILSKKLKDRMEMEIRHKYRPGKGAHGAMIIDGGLTPVQTVNTNFREQDINGSVKSYDSNIAQALGVPTVLIEGGNNANIRPNVELFYHMTVLPMMRKFESAFEAFFGYDIELTTHSIAALRPDAKEQSDRLTALVNNGIITGNEARVELRLEELDDEQMNKIRIPANVAGSATGVSGQEGGRPPKKEDKK